MENELPGVGDVEHEGRAEEPPHARWWLWQPGRDAHFRSVADRFPAIISLTTPAGDFEVINRYALDYFGATVDSLVGRSSVDTIHPEDLPGVIAARERSAEDGNPYQVRVRRRRRADGDYRWFHMRGFPLRDADGRIVLWYVLESDINDRQRAEDLLLAEKRLLEMVASGRSLTEVLNALCELVEQTNRGSYCGIVLVDETGTHIQHGAAPSLPDSYNDSINGRPVNVDAGPCAMAVCLNEQVISADVAAETRWAAYTWCPLALAHGLRACWSTPILSRDGKPLGAFAIYYAEPSLPTPQDQSLIGRFTHIASIAIERAHGEEALKRSEAFLAKAQHLSSTGSFSWREATDEIRWSKELYRIFEFDPGAPVTLAMIRARVHSDDLAAFDEAIARARSAGADYEHDRRLLMSDGSIKYLNVIAHGMSHPDGRREFIGAIQDVTQRRLAEEKLSKAQSELARVARATTLGALTASIAHEVSQPLSGIMTNAGTCLRMLEADPPDVDGARETARRMIRDSRRASDVITRLRALFVRGNATAEPVDLSEAAREVIALSSNELRRGRVTLRAELADELPTVTGDRVQLQQVILNLLLNAVEAMSTVVGRPRVLLINTRSDEKDRVRLTVTDSGVGLDPGTADRLFEAFVTSKPGGMGIGLSVSRSIIENHGGRIWFDVNEGPGLSFSFSLPRAAMT